jgi:hypothetical protein
MRALFLLFALVATGTLHAADLDAGEHRQGRCESRQADDAVHHGEAATTPEPVSSGTRGAADGIGDRNRMSPRWHSLLPGMYR